MSYTYDLEHSHHDKRASIGLHICHTINTINELFLSTFLIAYIYSFSTDIFDYIFKATYYEIVTYLVFFIAYYVASKIVNKTNRISVYRFSIFIWAAFVVFAIFYGEQIAQMIWLAGILCGLARGVYWSSFNVLKQEMIGKSTMNKFSTFSMILQKTVSVVFPITLGALIDVTSYSNAALVVLVFCLVQIFVSFLVKSKLPMNSDYNLKAYFKRLKEDNELNRRLKFLYKASFIYGMNNTVASFVNIYIMVLFGTNTSLGTITSFIAIAVILMTYFVGKFSKEGKRTPLYLSAAIISVFSVILYFLMPDKWTLILLNFVLSTSGVVFKLIFDMHRNKYLKEYGRYDDIAEHQGIIESILQISRVASYALILLLSLTKSMLVMNITFAFFALLFISNLFIYLFFEKKFCTNGIPNKAEI